MLEATTKAIQTIFNKNLTRNHLNPVHYPTRAPLRRLGLLKQGVKNFTIT